MGNFREITKPIVTVNYRITEPTTLSLIKQNVLLSIEQV